MFLNFIFASFLLWILIRTFMFENYYKKWTTATVICVVYTVFVLLGCSHAVGMAVWKVTNSESGPPLFSPSHWSHLLPASAPAPSSMWVLCTPFSYPTPKVNCLILFSLVRGSLFFDCFFWFFSLLFPIISSLLFDLPLLSDQGSFSSFLPPPGFSLPIVSHVPNLWPLSINPSQWGHSHWLLPTVSTFPSVWTP